MNNARFFGESPTHVFNGGGTGLKDLKTGYATISVLEDTVFATLQIGNQDVNSQSLDGIMVSAGTTLYGVKKYEVTSGTGIAYHSLAIV